MVYDITSKDTFSKLNLWINEINKYAGNKDLKIMILGNKLDLESERKVTTKEADEFSFNIGAKFMEVSAKATMNVDKAFEILTEEILKIHDKPLPKSNTTVDLTASKTKKKGLCLI